MQSNACVSVVYIQNNVVWDMKKTVIVLMGFIAVAMGFAACSSDDDNGSMLPDNTENEETTDSVQMGTEQVVDSAEVWSERDGNRIFGMMYYNSA